MAAEVARPLILASGSPRRAELLREAGFEFVTIVPQVEERPEPDETPETLARRLALSKARAVAARAPARCCVLAADTLVVLGERILGKPSDPEDAIRMLRALSGRVHRVLTGYALLLDGGARSELGVEESSVRMREIDPREARRYAAGGEPLDKAGAYAVQGDGGRFVATIQGSRSNVIGLPLETLLPRLLRHGVKRACPS